MKRNIHKQKGSTLLGYTVMVFSAMLLVVLTMNSIVINQLKMTSLQSESTKAYFAAEAGAEWLLLSIIKGNWPNPEGCAVDSFVNFTATPPTCGAQNDKILSNGAFTYIQKVNPVAPDTLAFKCYGEFNNAKRVIEISF